MNAVVEDFALHTEAALDEAIDAACRMVAPTWPLDRFIAVNPYWGLVDRPIEQAAAALSRLAGSAMWMSASYYRTAWTERKFDREYLAQAAAEAGIDASVDELLARLDRPTVPRSGLPLISDMLDAKRDLQHAPSWREAITHQVSQFCAAYFDTDQADWQPTRAARLFVAWRDSVASDPGTALLMNAPEVARRAATLPADPRLAIREVLDRLGVPRARVLDVLTTVLLRIGGWGAWCAYLRWEARAKQQDDETIVDLLAIRLAWEALLDDGDRDPDAVWAGWLRKLRAAPCASDVPENEHLGVFQRAMELAYQASLAAALARGGAAPKREAPEVQAVFCIDVRSEVYRRALESVSPTVQTFGFAGFFGLPVSYVPIGTDAVRPQLPGLLAPSLAVTDTCGSESQNRSLAATRRQRLAALSPLRHFGRMPASAFSLVETLGLGYLGKLLYRSSTACAARPVDCAGLTTKEHARLRPRLIANDVDTLDRQAGLAERILRAMSLVDRFAKIVLLVGHGSRSTNNTHAAGLDCGACCGQTGEVNARALAALLNDERVRAALAVRGIEVPASTWFLAALHDTTTDEVVLFDAVDAPFTHAEDIVRVKDMLDAAGRRARAERAPALGLSRLAASADVLRKALQRRAGDWAQTRPEWGLANNAAFVVAPRSRTAGINLGGRVFLHEYVAALDEDGSVLELIMTAPMIVTHWINMQYNASTVDNLRYGSGNKVLHNVVGGRIGVIEGNGGDLRIGLPLQSLHDGKRWVHTPQRLSVFIEAPRARIEDVIGKHTLVRQLLDHRWLFLLRIDSETHAIESYRGGRWLTVSVRREGHPA